MEVVGSPWLTEFVTVATLISAVLGLVTAIITATITLGPKVIEYRQARWTTAEPFAVIAQLFNDSKMSMNWLVLDDLQNRVRRLETMQM